MKRYLFILIGLLSSFTFLLSSCWFLGPSVRGDGNVTEETRQTGSFSRIDVSRGINVYVTQGVPAKVVVIADSNLHEVIKTKVEGNTLKIYADEIIRWSKEKKVLVTVETLSGVECSSGSNVWSQNRVTSESMELKASSGANMTFETNAKDLKATCSSGANVRLSGTAKDADLEVSSGANLKGEDLHTDNCKMKASSGGNVSANVNVTLEAHASSGGNVIYYGQPTGTNVDTSSGGNIHKK